MFPTPNSFIDCSRRTRTTTLRTVLLVSASLAVTMIAGPFQTGPSVSGEGDNDESELDRMVNR
jgi:hypothetical protein